MKFSNDINENLKDNDLFSFINKNVGRFYSSKIN